MPESTYAHFIGIGGAGMSGIALVLHERGMPVSGSDVRESRYTNALEREGISVTIGHRADNLGDAQVVVVSSAIPESNPELTEARKRGIPVWQRARMLAHLAEDRTTVAIAGTHGKTTTSSIVATMLSGMGLEPTFLIGGEVCAFGTNAVAGAGPHYVVEADESDGSFMHLDPAVLLIANVEADHLDHYGTLSRVEEMFVAFMKKVPPDGTLVLCGDDERLVELASHTTCRAIMYGCVDAADVRLTGAERSGVGYRATVELPQASVVLETSIPGMHNVVNAVGALAVAHALGLDVRAAADALSGFAGVKRRFEQVGMGDDVTVVDDYAHHPTEVAVTLGAARQLGFRRVWAVFQPHRYSRTAALAEEFGSAFGDADRLVLLDIYGAGETPIPGVSGRTILDAVFRHAPRTSLVWLPHRADVAPYLASEVRSGDLVITMGAGDVTALGPEILRAISSTATQEG